MWTSGYDLFSPSVDVTSHIYVRRHKPKFWETFNRVWGRNSGGHNAIQLRVIDRVKSSLGYPESSSDMVHPKSILDHLDEYGMGQERPLETYLDMVGIDVRGKVTYQQKDDWCHKGLVPPHYGERREELQKLYA
ncbi:hypothetical protein TrRE_jg11326 [Triparma retinervis]|uniref:Uncharacterized protein n=1 Tax=Triparma retinervis TaxID=2557542 RepID=A0A9W7E333_9STRA|nr:hypothetical protein TrRE_jg11326 [Triparma retinervis]